MSRPGRPRRSGQRESNGRIQRLNARDRDQTLIEKRTVLAQPHRRAFGVDQFAESPLGRFVLRHKLPRPLYDAGAEWGNLVRHYHAAKVGTMPMVQLGFGSGRGVSPEKAKFLSAEAARIEQTLRPLSPVGFAGARDLCVYEKDCHPGAAPEVIGVLHGLARLLRKIDDRHARIQAWREEA